MHQVIENPGWSRPRKHHPHPEGPEHFVQPAQTRSVDVEIKQHTSLGKISRSSLPLTALLSTTELEPYKYAGYPMLIKTITMETEDSQLFSKTSPLLPAAVELAFHTVNCSALNAEELRRDNGIEVHVD